MRILLITIILACSTFAQDAEKYSCSADQRVLVAKYLKNQAANDEFAERLRKPQKGQLPFCWHTCAVSLVKPYFPAVAKTLKIQGAVRMYTIANEEGLVIYAKPISGPTVFRQAARSAACKARFKPIRYDDRPITFPWTILYNFSNITDAQIL